MVLSKNSIWIFQLTSLLLWLQPLFPPDLHFIIFSGVSSYWNSLNCFDPEGCQLSLASLRLVCQVAKRVCDQYIVDHASFMGSVSGMVKLYGLGFRPTDICCHLAASRGNLSCLIYAYQNLYVPLGESLSIAQSRGFKHILNFARRAGWRLAPAKLELRWTDDDQVEYFDVPE